MAAEIADLIRALEDDPQARGSLRRVLFPVDPDVRETLVGLAKHMAALTERVDALAKDLRELAVAQRQTQDDLRSLVDVVSGMHDRLARLDGSDLERSYREKGHAYLAPIALRLRLLDGSVLSPLIGDAEEAGVLTGTRGAVRVPRRCRLQRAAPPRKGAGDWVPRLRRSG